MIPKVLMDILGKLGLNIDIAELARIYSLINSLDNSLDKPLNNHLKFCGEFGSSDNSYFTQEFENIGGVKGHKYSVIINISKERLEVLILDITGKTRRPLRYISYETVKEATDPRKDKNSEVAENQDKYFNTEEDYRFCITDLKQSSFTVTSERQHKARTYTRVEKCELDKYYGTGIIHKTDEITVEPVSDQTITLIRKCRMEKEWQDSIIEIHQTHPKLEGKEKTCIFKIKWNKSKQEYDRINYTEQYKGKYKEKTDPTFDDLFERLSEIANKMPTLPYRNVLNAYTITCCNLRNVIREIASSEISKELNSHSIIRGFGGDGNRE